MDLNILFSKINKELLQLEVSNKPIELYEPIRYILDLGGKRLRPMLVILAYSLYKKDFEKILKPAAAVEVFHNFTLMHDDIMDEAPLRRGKKTVHEKWDSNLAILSGDVMLIKAYELFEEIEGAAFKRVIKAFNACAIQVCEGQQHDMNFETKDTITADEYMEMIRQKTAVLIGFSLELGAILAGASEEDCKRLKAFGIDIGIGFQLKDDLLDVYADKADFGKQVGGDIIANKKTFLLIKALENADTATKIVLDGWLKKVSFDKKEKVEAVKEIYDKLNIQYIAAQKMNEYFEKGFQSLAAWDVDEEQKNVLLTFTKNLINRKK